MIPFNVYVDLLNNDNDAVKNILSSISSLYHSFTSKHQRKTAFIFDIQPDRIKFVKDISKTLEIDTVISFATMNDIFILRDKLTFRTIEYG